MGQRLEGNCNEGQPDEPSSSIPPLYSHCPLWPLSPLVTTQTMAPEGLRTGSISFRFLIPGCHARVGQLWVFLSGIPHLVGLRANLDLELKGQGFSSLGSDPGLLSTLRGRGSCWLQSLRPQLPHPCTEGAEKDPPRDPRPSRWTEHYVHAGSLGTAWREEF